MRSHRFVWGCVALVVLSNSARAEDAQATEFFEKKIRPALATHCFKCHSAETKRRGGLHLDSRAAMLKGGDSGPALIPKDPDKSRLVQAIRYTGDLRMPPKTRLPKEVVADLTKWVALGAPWPNDSGTVVKGEEKFDLEERKKHWAFQPMKLVSPAKTKNTQWARTAIDQYLLAGLEAKGLEPAAPTDRITWLRRVTFALTGIPPTRAEIRAFLDDDSSVAYERVADRLLASPRYGERWGRHWLDLVRFAETRGHEFDFEMPEAFEYRDYIIRAFNADVPYDRFVIEHIAGDRIDEPRRDPATGINESVIGPGFWFLGEGKHSPVDLRVDGAERRENQIDVFGKTFLGLTIACARCHDHKFDAILTKDYYSLVSVLQSSRYSRAFVDAPERIARPAKQARELHRRASVAVRKLTRELLEPRVKAVSDWTKGDPLIEFGQELFDPANKSKEKFQQARAAVLSRLKERQKRNEQTWKSAIDFEDFSQGDYRDWHISGEAFGTRPTGPSDALIDPGKPIPAVRLREQGVAHSGLVSGRLQGAIRSKSFTISKRFIHYKVAGKGTKINLIIDGFQLIRNPIYGGLEKRINSGDKFVWIRQDVSMWRGLRAYIEILDDGPGFAALDQVVFSDGGVPREEPVDARLVKLLERATEQDQAQFVTAYKGMLEDTLTRWLNDKGDGQDAVLLDRILRSKTLLSGIKVEEDSKTQRKAMRFLLDEANRRTQSVAAPRRVMGIEDGTAVRDWIHVRGNPKNLGKEAERHFLVALAGEDQAEPETTSGRLMIARELTDPQNPLVARVMVNRLWHHHFGRGIVSTVDNFGRQGSKPTHPELLDYLALELQRRGWSLKSLQREIVLSSVYRMSSQSSDEKADEVDAQNALLHKMPIRRLEAEAIRDSMLAVSGRLVTRMYGRGPLPFITPFMVGRGRPRSGPLDGDGRRSIYINVRRNFLEPMFLAFDYPTPFSSMGKRSVSNVPAQALILLNNPFVIQQAKLWASSVLDEPDLTTEQRIVRLYLSAFSRPPTEQERQDAQAFLAEQGRVYGQPNSPKAWEDLCHVLFNVKEFIFVN